jgi:isoleucyl-tRNA synthetase
VGNSDKEPDAPYPDLPQQPSYPELEEAILQFWDEDGTFQASLDLHPPGSEEFVFYDGPPFANGLPHYGHLLTGFVKDAIPRYQTMRGRRVERRFGWDCHGLPAEMETEKELGVSGRVAIEGFGVDRFNGYCRTLVQRTTDAWARYVRRQARWVDMVNDYRTMDLPFMESVIWAFKTLYEKGLVYQGQRVLPYCWECETPLSNFETRQDDAYRPRKDPAVTVAFTALPLSRADDLPGASSQGDSPASAPASLAGALAGSLDLLAWTTTPWTLPSNLALAMNPEITYALFRLPGRSNPAVATPAWLESHREKLGEVDLLGTFSGSVLIGRRYKPLFPYFADHQEAFRVLGESFVSAEEGTGIVHLAPGFGEDDQKACEAAGISLVCPVDERARFTSEVPDFQGMQVFETNQLVIEQLESMGALVTKETYEHAYPHCWRTDTPLVYRAIRSWFVNVTAVKQTMLECNQQIHWVPEHVRDGAFGKWLEGARDWSISRNRFWGAPIPVWESSDPRYPRLDVYGSLEELERDFNVHVEDLHRPEIDELTRPNPDDPTGQSVMRRVPEVLDCWFESGSMPFAQLHYPFEHRESFEAHFPADFIVEYIGQTRGWFYTLHVLASAIFSKPAFRHCIAHGIVLGDDGRKLSKRLGNFPDPERVFDTYGADAMRWFMLSAAILRGQDLQIEETAISEAVRQALNPLWNAWYFLALYGNADGVRGSWRTDQTSTMDRYLLAKLHELVVAVTEAMDHYDLPGACAHVSGFLDALTNWYIRRCRDRFWRPAPTDRADKEDPDKQAAYDTLHTALMVTCKVAAPLLPLLTESIYKGLTKERSVHLTPWPDASELPEDAELVMAHELARQVCSAGHSIRKANHLRVRTPLAKVTVAIAEPERLAPLCQIIAEELNVEIVDLTDDMARYGEQVLQVNPKVLGPRLGSKVQEVIREAKAGRWKAGESGTILVAGETLSLEECSLELVPKNTKAARALPGNAGIVVLDIELTGDLRRQGQVRELVHVIQGARRSAGLHVSDRIELTLKVPSEMLAMTKGALDEIETETLASRATVLELDSSEPEHVSGRDLYVEQVEVADVGEVVIMLGKEAG